MQELKIKCPSDILTSYNNNKTKILFEFRPEHNKYTLIKKTKEFFLEEINTFSNELIHFFNINKNNSSIFIYLEVEGKKIKSEQKNINYYKLVLKDIKNVKREIICLILEQIELKIFIRIINNNKKEKAKSNDINKTDDNNIKNKDKSHTPLNGYSNFGKPLTIQDKIRLFNGEFIKRKIYRNENIPGKVKIPEIFLPHNNDKENKTKEDIKNEKKE